jgi:hypothetical protein
MFKVNDKVHKNKFREEKERLTKKQSIETESQCQRQVFLHKVQEQEEEIS